MSVRREVGGGPAAGELERALAERGVPCKVEERAGLAVLVVDTETLRALGDAELRKAALELARAQGFTHVAIELRDDAGPSPAGRAALPRD